MLHVSASSLAVQGLGFGIFSAVTWLNHWPGNEEPESWVGMAEFKKKKKDGFILLH